MLRGRKIASSLKFQFSLRFSLGCFAAIAVVCCLWSRFQSPPAPLNSAVHLSSWQGYSVRLKITPKSRIDKVEIKLRRGQKSICSQILEVSKNVKMSVMEQPRRGRVVVKSSDEKILVHVYVIQGRIDVIKQNKGTETKQTQ